MFKHATQCEKLSFTGIFDSKSTSRSNHNLLLGSFPELTSMLACGSDAYDQVAIRIVIPIFWSVLGSWIAGRFIFMDDRFNLYTEGIANFELTICKITDRLFL